MSKKLLVLLSMMMVLALILAACGGTEEEEPAEVIRITAEPPEETMEEGMGETGPGTYLDRAYAGEFENSSLTIMSVWPDEEISVFNESLAPFKEATGINISTEGSGDFETLIIVRTEAGDPPDMAIFPQPGLMADFANQDHLADLTEILDMSALGESYSSAWTDLGTVDGTLVGLPYRVQTKSLVFYEPEKWAEFGYEPPETWDEMIALMDEMVANGHTPWCIPLENSGATGWVATDWVEEIVLRTAGHRTDG